jgi:aryl-alcohol dehydrogenase-like predicted oxidoreductase
MASIGDLRVSRLCLGAMSFGDPRWNEWVMGEAEARPFIERALTLGINFFDSAEMYSHGVSEEILGRALRDFARRDDVIIATKVTAPPHDDCPGGLSPQHIAHAVDDSLRRLGVDHVDLYQIHRWDDGPLAEDIMAALDAVVRSGKVRYIGASNMYAWQFAKMLNISADNGWAPFVSMQNHHNLIYREEEREMNPLCRDHGVALVPWSPMARGFLAGNRHRAGGGDTVRSRTDPRAVLYGSDDDYAVLDAAKSVATRHRATPTQVGLAWLLTQPGMTAPIIGTTRMQHLEDAVAALEISLTDEDRAELEAPYRAHPVLGID